MATVFEPIRPVPPMTMIFMRSPPVRAIGALLPQCRYLALGIGACLTARGPLPKLPPDQVRGDAVPSLVLSSDSHVFEPADLWQTRIDAAFRDRAPRIQRIDGADQIVVEADQVLSGIGLISNAGARFRSEE